MITAASRKTTPNEWIDFVGSNVGYVKQGFRDQVLESIQNREAAARQRLTERLEQAEGSTLTPEQRQYLQENFDPENMSRLDYQAFLDKLCEYGVLDEEDREFLDYGFAGAEGMTQVRLTGDTMEAHLSPDRGNPLGYSRSFLSSRGNVLNWAKYLSGVEHWDEGGWTQEPEAVLFERVWNVLSAISK